MATARIRIDQAGLAAGVAGNARLDGLSNGALVSLTSVIPGTTNTFRLLSVPPLDDVALDSLSPAGGGGTPVWSFTPKPGVRGAYLVELIVDAGLSGESRQRRLFGIPTWRHGLVAPALNEKGDPTARAEMTGTELANALARIDRNVDRAGAPSVDGWQRPLVDMANAIELGNYSQQVVPPGELCIIPVGQTMLYAGALHGDYQGSLHGVGNPPMFRPLWKNGIAGNRFIAADVATLVMGQIAMFSLSAGEQGVIMLPVMTPNDVGRICGGVVNDKSSNGSMAFTPQPTDQINGSGAGTPFATVDGSGWQAVHFWADGNGSWIGL